MKHFRIRKQVVNSAIDDINAGETLNGAHVDAVISTYNKILAFDQFRRHLLREVRVFKVRGIKDARGQHHNLRGFDLARRQRREHLFQLNRIVIYRVNDVVKKQFREHPLHDLAIFKHVRHTGRDSQIVFEDVHLAVFVADKV